MSTKTELVDAIERGWRALQTEVDALSDAQLTTLRDAEGWSVKDHLAHIAAWERSAAYFLQGRPRYEGLGVEEPVYLSGDDDTINAAIHARTKDLPLDAVRTELRDAHDELLRALEPLDDGDLQRAYRHFLPDEPGEGDGPPAERVVSGNSWEHYAEHLEWIRALVRA